MSNLSCLSFSSVSAAVFLSSNLAALSATVVPVPTPIASILF